MAMTILLLLPFVVVFLVIEGIVFEFEHLPMFFRWLKGSRMSFYLRPSNGGLGYQSCNMRGAILHSVIELSRGPFRRRSAIYGKNSKNWKVVVGHWDKNCIEIQEREGISVTVEEALRLVTQYSSLHDILDRIAELERECNTGSIRRSELRAIVRALLEIINADRQKYRSQAVQHIREFLEQVELQATVMCEPNPTEEQVEIWKQLSARIIEGH